MGTSRKWKTKDNICTRCGETVENMNREEQDIHEKECIKQTKIL